MNDVDRDKFALYYYDYENNIRITVHGISKDPWSSRSVILETADRM